VSLWRRIATWVRLSLFEGRLPRGGYRRLHEMQVEEAQDRTKRVIHDLADAVIVLRTVAEQVEEALEELGERFDDD
jgi:CRISPR/Cas system-associated endoribonuclease Cas2